MFNTIGKTLVILNLGLSVVFLAFATGLFTNQIDWGWKEPRKVLDTRVPSEIDKRTAAVKTFLAHREKAEKAVEQAQARLRVDEQNWAEYHLEYDRILGQLDNAPGALKIEHVKLDGGKKGQPVFDSKHPGKIQFEGDVEFVDSQGNKSKITKSFTKYDEELHDLQQQVVAVRKEVRDEVKELETMTKLIGGVHDPDMKTKVKPGIVDLLEDEKQLQKQIKRETEEIEPLWVRKLVEAQIIVGRRDSLSARLKELKAQLDEKKP